MTTIYLSGTTSSLTHVSRMVAQGGWDFAARPPALLLSYAYRDGIDAVLAKLPARQLMLDSGAFTAATLGQTISMAGLIAEAQDPRWTEVVSLDVIGDWRASATNAETMTAQLGGRVLPVFHIGEPWSVLVDYCARWPKVGVGGMVGHSQNTILGFLDQVFARAWPKRLHAFGVSGEDVLLRYPLHSCDTAGWLQSAAIRSQGVQRGQAFDAGQIKTPAKASLLVQWVDEMWRREQRVRDRWAAELAQLDAA